MNIWAIANQKGGVGKTTTSISLAAHLSLRGYRVLMVDLDPHGSLSTYLSIDIDSDDPGVFSLFQQSGSMETSALQACVQTTAFDKLSIMSAHSAMAALDRKLGNQAGMGRVLAQNLSLLENQFDYVLLDCPPMLGVLMINALAAADRLVIPVQTEFLAIKGLERMVRTLQMMSRSMGKSLPFHVVPTLYDKRTRASQESFQRLRKDYGQDLWPRYIPIDTQFRESSRKQIPLPLDHPGCRGSLAYSVLLDFLLKKARES